MKRKIELLLSRGAYSRLRLAFGALVVVASASCGPKGPPAELAPGPDFGMPGSGTGSAPDRALAAALERAITGIESWDRAERARWGSPTTEDGALHALPLDGMAPVRTAAEIRPYQYARRTVLFDVRRAAQFLKLIRPDLPPFLVGDMSMSDGSTPVDAWGLRHPAGAHVGGVSADLSYPGRTTAMPASLAELDIEAAAWMMYSLLQSPAIESVYTGYKEPLLAKAIEWRGVGLIGDEALTRFRNDLWQDTSLNHGSHLHINTASRPGLLLDPRNDFYRCFDATSGAYGTIWSRRPGC